MGKLRSLKNNNLTNSKKKSSQNEDNSEEISNVVSNFNSIGESKKSGVVKKVQFKKFKKEGNSTIAKVFFYLIND